MMHRTSWVLCLYLLIVCAGSLAKPNFVTHRHPALNFYEVIERGALQGVPFSPLYCRSNVDWFIGGTLDVYPCADEPYLTHTNIRNSRNNMDVAALPYNTPFEGGSAGNFFTMYSSSDDTLVPKYIGPVSTHIFPPPADRLEEWLLRMPRATVEEVDGRKEYTYTADFHFDIDIGRSYYYPRDASFRYQIDEPIYLYDDATQEFHIERLWGTSRLMRTLDSGACQKFRVQVNEPKETTELVSCDGVQGDAVQKALAHAQQMATRVLEYLQHVPDNCIKTDTVTTWFGSQATEVDNLSQIRAVFEQAVSFASSWFVCEEKENAWFTNTSVDPDALKEKYLVPHLQRLHEAAQRGDEKVEPNEEVVDDPRGLKNLELHCTPGMASWLIPRDASRTVHLCPLFFTLDATQQARVLLDTVIRFNESLIDILLGAEESKNLAATQPTAIPLQNAPSYVYLAEAIWRSTEEEDYVIADL